MKILKLLFIILILKLFIFNVISQSPKWINYNKNNSVFSENVVFSITFDKYGNKFFGCGYSIIKYDDKDWTSYSLDTIIQYHGNVTAINFDKGNTLWAGTMGGDLFTYDGTKWLNENQNILHILSDQRVSQICVDSLNRVWISIPNYERDQNEGNVKYYYKGLLTEFDGKNWTYYNISDTLKLLRTIIGDLNINMTGNKWLAMDSSIIKYDGKNWTIYDLTKYGLPSTNIVTCVKIDSKNNLWLGTNGGGLVKYDGQNWTIYNDKNSGLTDNYIDVMDIDKNDIIWYIHGYYSGISKTVIRSFDGENKFTSYDSTNIGIPNNLYISVIKTDTKGNKWIGTRGNGLFVFNENGVLLNETSKPQSTIQNSQFTITPNPVKESAEVNYSLKEKALVSIKVYDIMGREVKEVLNQSQDKGEHKLNLNTSALSPGLYLLKLQSKDELSVKKFVKQ